MLRFFRDWVTFVMGVFASGWGALWWIVSTFRWTLVIRCGVRVLGRVTDVRPVVEKSVFRSPEEIYEL